MAKDKHKTQSDPVDVVSMGCRLNGYESERMAELAQQAGLQQSVVINSCAVTNEAVRQTRQKIRQLHKSSPDTKIIVTGCAAQIDPVSFSQMPEVHSVLGNKEKLETASWQNIVSPNATPVSVSDIMAATKVNDALPVPQNSGRTRSYVQIQNGCDHRCTFCIIPYGRGNSRSVPIQQIIDEIEQHVASGTKEVVLTGVDITSYGADLDGTPSLGLLVRRILNSVPELYRLRLSSIDGAEIDEELVDIFCSSPRIAPHLHLSLQAGDNMILKRMKRRHNREQAIEFCQMILSKRPETVFGADIIAGFPTETEEMFENSLRLTDECDLSYLHVFPFSPRSGTPAALMPQLERPIIKERAARLREKGDQRLSKLLDRFKGETATLLTEKPSTDMREKGVGRGRLDNFAEVVFESNNAKHIEAGQLLEVALNNHNGRHLIGSIIKEV